LEALLSIYHTLSTDGAYYGQAQQIDVFTHEVALSLIKHLDQETISSLYLPNNQTAMMRYMTLFSTAKERRANWTAEVGTQV
jgi:hypothetical protein